MSHGVSAAAHAVRSGDSHGGGHSVDLSERDILMFKRPSVRYGRTPEPETPYQRAGQVWDERIGAARVQAKNWRLMAFGSLILSASFATALVWQSLRGTRRALGGAGRQTRPGAGGRARRGRLPADRSADRLVSGPLHRRCPQHPGRSDHRAAELARAYDFTTTDGAAALNEYARADDPFAKLGKQQIAVDVSSVIRASPDRSASPGCSAATRTARWPKPPAGPPSSPS